jgi:hypothetical protein
MCVWMTSRKQIYMMYEICKVNVGSTKNFFNYKKMLIVTHKMLQDSQYLYPYASYAFEQKIVKTVMLLTIVH